MITGYKKKKLGHPSEKLSGDVPRAGWRAVIVSEVIFPIVMAVLFVVAYMFVKSFPLPDGKQPPAPLIRIAVISLGPIVWNAAVLLTLFLVSLFLGPMLDQVFPLFGAVMAFIAHILGVVGMLGFFEFLVCFFLYLFWKMLTFYYFSGSSSFGMHHMLCSASSPSLRSNGAFTKYSLRCFYLVSSSTTKQTVHGGQADGMGVASEHMSCLSPLESLL
jgi:hypothetical protein